MLDSQSKAPEAHAEAPSLKADDLGSSSMQLAVAQQMRGGDVGAGLSARGGGARTAGDAAADGFRGSAQEIPHRGEMERSFGMDFGGVQAYTGASAQAGAKQLGAHGYAVGNQVAFASQNPDKALVAHELTHVVQHGGGNGVARKAAGGAAGAEIDTSGEGEAEKVESAVKAGKPASSALEGGVAKQGGPRLKSGKGIARKEGEGGGAPFTFGMTFSPEGLEKQYFWNLWKGPEFEVPIPAVPGLNFKVKPQVQLVAAGGLNWKEKQLETQLNLLGSVGVGLSYGKAELAEVYAVMEANAQGGFNYKYKYEQETAHEEGGHAPSSSVHAPEPAPEHAPAHAPEHHAEPKNEAKSWELSGDIQLYTDFAVGVELAGGWLDYRFEFGDCDIGKLTGLNWKDGHFDRSAVGWEWGAKPKEFFAAMRAALQKAQALQKMGVEAYKKGLETAKATGQAVYKAGADVVHWVTSW